MVALRFLFLVSYAVPSHWYSRVFKGIQAGVAEPADARDLNVATIFDFLEESRLLSADYPRIKMRQKMTRLNRVALC